MDPLTKIVRLLPQLDANQLDQLVIRIKALQQFGTLAGPPASDEHFVLNAISETLHAHGADYTAVAVMRKVVTAKLEDGHSFRDKIPGLMAFLHMAHPSTVGQHALLLLGLQFLLLDMRKRGGFVSYRSLMAQIHRIGPALDAHFPGYAQAGLLRLAVERPIIPTVSNS
jgi:hypothetical protein